jgi:hypothetical protein
LIRSFALVSRFFATEMTSARHSNNKLGEDLSASAARRIDAESAMSEVEFDRMLDAVRTAVAPAPDFSAHPLVSLEPPTAANDNEDARPFHSIS